MMKSAFERACLATLSALTLSLLTFSPNAQAQQRRPRPTEVPPAGQTTPDGKPGAPPPKPGTPKPYKEVVTAEAKTDKGLFTVHRIEDKVLFEIPVSALNREMLWSTEIAQLPAGFGYGGTAAGDRVVRWTRRNNKIYLRNVDYSLRADDGDKGIKRAVEAASLEPIIQGFDVEAEGEGKSAVIDVTRFLTSDPSEFAVKGDLGGTGVDPGRSYVERIKSFPDNVEMRSTMTFNLGGQPGGAFGRRFRAANLSSATVIVHYSMVLLPEKPMRGRLFDSRVGYFTEGFQDFGRPENRVVNRQYITRYRLEKKDPSAAVSEPVKPIVYYVSREVPEQWRSYIKQGIEDWQPAFEA